MSEAITYRPADEIPQAAGWYRVRRTDDPDKPLVRAFGQDHWWIPLPDGWITADGCYEWESLPICPVADEDDPITPIEEMKRAQSIVLNRLPQTTGSGT